MQSQLSIERQIQLALNILKNGGIVAFPTDTVYGIGASAINDQAIVRIYEAKQRPRHMALPLLIADRSELATVASSVPDVAWKLAERFLPGGLTLVLQKAPWVSTIATAGGNTIAVRIPDHPIPIALIRGLGVPLIGTSANISGKPSPVTADEVSRQMGDKLDFIIDGGQCPQAVASTVIDLTGGIPRILRQGAVPREAIEKVCPVLKGA